MAESEIVLYLIVIICGLVNCNVVLTDICLVVRHIYLHSVSCKVLVE